MLRQRFGFARRDEALVSQAVADEVGDGDHPEAVVGAEVVELRDAGHGAVVVHDFADDAAGVEAGQAGEIDGGFGLAGADEHAAFAGAEREDVAGAGEIGGSRCRDRWPRGWCGRGRRRRCRW